MTGSVIGFGCLQLHSRFAAQVSRDPLGARAIARTTFGKFSSGKVEGIVVGQVGSEVLVGFGCDGDALLPGSIANKMAARRCRISVVVPWRLGESGQAGSSARRRRVQEWFRIIAASINAV